MKLTYNGVTYDEIGMAFSKQIVTDLLRGQLGFQGYVNSDTGIINDRAWGLEEKTVPERVATAINGGTETLSGFHDVKTITDLVQAGLVTEARVTEAAKRLLKPMFLMGLFENPYVDETAANGIVGSQANRDVGLEVQRKSVVLLQNKDAAGGSKVLPLKAASKVYILGDFTKARVESYGYTVIDGNATPRPPVGDSDYVLISITARNPRNVTSTYISNSPATGLNPAHINPIVLDGVRGLDGKSPYGAADACVSYGAAACTDSGLIFGGSFPWESGILDFTGISTSESWQVVPSLDTIKAVMSEVGDP